MNFLDELLAYNQQLRDQGFIVVIGPHHNINGSAHFIYRYQNHIFDLIIPFQPTNFTKWNELQQSVKSIQG